MVVAVIVGGVVLMVFVAVLVRMVMLVCVPMIVVAGVVVAAVFAVFVAMPIGMIMLVIGADGGFLPADLGP